MSEDWTLQIGCTDRGQHRWTRIATVQRTIGADGEVARTMPVRDSWTFPDEEAVAGTGISRNSYRFVCSRCPRHWTIDRDRWWTALRAVVETTEVAQIDLSLLPF